MALSPKQKKIAKMAGDPNKIEGEDFKAMKTNSGPKVEKAFLGKLFGKKSSTAQPSNQKTVNSTTTGMGMGKLIPHLLQQAMSDGTIKSDETIKASNGKMIMARGCKMGKNKPTKLS